jgi:YD repeat-containing protein
MTWVPVSATFLGHRPEPLIHERVWACPLTGAGDVSARFDEQGRAVAKREDDHVEEVTFEPGRIVVRHRHGLVVETHLDEAGRPVRSVYPSGEEERYRYDDAGRLIEIDEAAGLSNVEGARYETGGLLRVEYDEQGILAIRGEGETVWERPAEPWPELLARGARTLADMFVEAVAWAEPGGAEVFALSLIYVDTGGLPTTISLGLEDERRAWSDPEEYALGSWYLIRSGGGLDEIDVDDVPVELERVLLRGAALNDPGEPQRTVLNAAAAVLARHDWNGLITPTDDFVVFIAEHDEGYSDKHKSVRAVNPPERLAAWDARWPSRAPRDDAYSYD